MVKATIKAKKRKKHRGGLAPNRYLSKAQFEKLKQHLEGKANSASTLLGLRRARTNLMLVYLMANSGLRVSEVSQLQMMDLPQCHGKLIIDVREGKGCVQRSVEISSVLAKRITQFTKKYRRTSKPKSPLFVNEDGGPLSYRSIYSKLMIISREADVGHLNPHKFRHTYGTRFYTQTKDTRTLQDQLGHADIRTTVIYTRTEDEERRRLIEAFEA